MKYIVISLLIGLTSCKQEEVEIILFGCLQSSFEEVGVDLSSELDKLEKHLIDADILNSRAGQSYYDFYTQVAENNDNPTSLEFGEFAALTQISPNEYYSEKCLKSLRKLDSVEIEKSKCYQMLLRIQATRAKGEITLSAVASAVLSATKAADFERPYYRAIALLSILHTANIENGLLLPQRRADRLDCPSVSILVNGKDEIILGDKSVQIETLENELYKFIKKNERHHQILFSIDRTATYDFYLKIQNKINDVYLLLRDEKAKEFYDKSFSDLTDIKKADIKEIYPQNIKEK